MKVVTATRDDPRRQAIEAFIRRRYIEAYDADLEALPSTLIAGTVDGVIVCAAGLRTASDGFFCEVYVDTSAEDLIETKTCRAAPRSKLFEVTSLCSSSPLVSIDFLRAVALFGFNSGFNWSIFVATERLSRLLRLLSFEPLELAPASAARIHNREIWGSYYDTSPTVMAVNRAAIAKFDWARQPSRAACVACSCPLFSSVASARETAARARDAA